MSTSFLIDLKHFQHSAFISITSLCCRELLCSNEIFGEELSNTLIRNLKQVSEPSEQTVPCWNRFWHRSNECHCSSVLMITHRQGQWQHRTRVSVAHFTDLFAILVLEQPCPQMPHKKQVLKVISGVIEIIYKVSTWVSALISAVRVDMPVGDHQSLNDTLRARLCRGGLFKSGSV